MGLLADWQIKKFVKIEPFAEEAHRPGTVSYGVSSYGYDVRVGRHFKVFTNVYGTVIDPKKFEPKAFVDIEGDSCVIPPNSFALAETVEYFEIPRDVLATCLGKSTYARCGTSVARSTSTRCSSTRCACPTRTGSEQRVMVGGSPARPWPGNARWCRARVRVASTASAAPVSRRSSVEHASLASRPILTFGNAWLRCTPKSALGSGRTSECETVCVREEPRARRRARWSRPCGPPRGRDRSAASGRRCRVVDVRSLVSGRRCRVVGVASFTWWRPDFVRSAAPAPVGGSPVGAGWRRRAAA